MFSVLLTAAAFWLQFVSAQTQCDRSYIVQEGDICDRISAANNVSTFQLAAVNYGIIDSTCDNLIPGQSICLGEQGEDCNQTYVVVAGDTCDGVAAAFSLNQTVFGSNNPQLDAWCDNLYVGEVVAVCDSVMVPATPSGTIPGSAIPPTSTPAVPWCD